MCVPEAVWLLHCTHNKPLSDWQNQYLAIALACAHSGGSVCSPRHASQFYKHNVRSWEKRPVFWLMSPWQLHNSWIVLVIHFSFANHNSGCVFAEGWLERKCLLHAHTQKQSLPEMLTYPCPNLGGRCSLEAACLIRGPFSFMNSQVCAFGKLHANSPT